MATGGPFSCCRYQQEQEGNGTVKIHVEQTTDTEWEIRTGDDLDDRTRKATVIVTGPTSAKSDYHGKSGRTPGYVIGVIIDEIRGDNRSPFGGMRIQK